VLTSSGVPFNAENFRFESSTVMTLHSLEREPGLDTSAHVNASDESLLESIAAGNEDALLELIRRHRRSVRIVVTRIVSCPADAEEVVQDVFLILWRCAGTFRGQAKVTTWIQTIARNAAVSRRRHDRLRQTLVVNAVPFREPIAESCDPERRAAILDLTRQLVARIEQLSPEHRAVIVAILRFGSATKAAAQLDLLIGTIKSRLHRARLALRAARTLDLSYQPNR
jgi:RNA polymerase sigma-70 factor (ECF subfamily)